MAGNKIVSDEKIVESMEKAAKAAMETNNKQVDKRRVDCLRAVCCPMWFESCNVDEKGEFSYKIKFLNVLQQEQEVVIKRADFTASNIRKLITAHGGYVYDERVAFDYLKQMESYALGYREPINETLKVDPIKFVNTYIRAGWFQTSSGDIGFVSAKGCYINGKLQENSEYDGKLGIDVNGTLKNYKSMIKKYILDKANIPLQAGLAMGCASVLLWYFNNILHKKILNSIICLSGEEGTGKSTTLELISSFSGKPTPFAEKGITPVFNLFNSTEGALTNLDYNFGYPIALDDTQHCDNKIRDAVFYELAAGQSKKRLKSNGKLAENSSEYTTGIFISGEHSIFENLSESGLKPRIIELADIQWTYDGNYADSIKNEVYANYGILVPLIAKYILDAKYKGGDEELLKNYTKWENQFLKEAEEKHCYVHDTHRVVKTLALFMVALEVLSNVLKQEYKTGEVYKFFFDNVVMKKAQEEQISLNVYNQLLDYINTHKYYFHAMPRDIANNEVLEESSKGESIIEMSDENNYIGEIIYNTPKISSRVNKCEYSVFMSSADALYVLQTELGVQDFSKFINEMLEAKLLIWTETQCKGDKKVPRPDCKYKNQRGYRFALPNGFVPRVKEDK